MKKLIFVLTCLISAIPCQARIITVDDDGFAEFNNIQAAINDSNDGDIIIVQIGQYIENINFMGKNITLRSTEPLNPSVVESTIINGNLSGSVVTFAGTESPTCYLSGFTITNGSGTGVGDNYGGGIYGNGTLATIQHNIISGNQAASYYWPCSGYGGGIYDCDGTIRYNVILENHAVCDEGTASGGGIYGCDGIIKSNSIWGNSAGGFAGGWGFIEGGGLSNCNGDILNNVVSGNYAGGWWGGARGGGLSNCNGTIQNNTIFGNRSEETRSGYIDYGGGLSGCDGTIRNCIIWQNIADQGTQIYESSTPSFSCIENWGSGGDGNIDFDPRFVSVGYWHLCGLPPRYPCWVETGDYHLRSLAGRWDPDEQIWLLDSVTSPCIDAGNPGCPLGDEPAPNGNRRNMGAYGGTAEASKSPANWRSIADLTNDWAVDSNDLKVFADYWLESGECIPSDFDHNQFVDFSDFAIFGLQWSYPSASEPGITYQIEKCDPNSFRSPAAEQETETRFTVIVEGSYIHFTDMMVANCCTDKLGLEMTVEDNLITIYEIEYIPGVCFCICDYPVTATLGPFEPDAYVLEVYEDWGGFIGSTIVVIDPPL